MTPGERFRAAMTYGAAECVPLLDEGIRDDVIDAWHAQGLPTDARLDTWFHYDRVHTLALDLGPRPPLAGPPLTARACRTRRQRLDPSGPGRWDATPGPPEDAIVELPIHHGLFLTLGVGDWTTFESVLLLLADAPERAREILDGQAAFAAALADRILARRPIDFATFSEPIASRHGPLIAPKLYRDLVLASYRPILDTLRRHGVGTIVWVTFGNAAALIGSVLDAGFTALWAHERAAAEMDYPALRRRFGRSLRLIGGIDLDAITAGPSAIDAEMRRVVDPLLADGGYIPLADGRIRRNTPFGHYLHYRRALETRLATPPS